jgi:hypothetical protein
MRLWRELPCGVQIWIVGSAQTGLGWVAFAASLGSLSLTTTTKSTLPTNTPSTDDSDRATSLRMRCPLRQVDLVHSPPVDA